MPALDYLVLDVFTDRPLAGNPLGVFPNAAELDGETMQSIARELNLSETVFITERVEQAGAPRFTARIFTPGQEVPFAGHPSIGCAWHLLRTAAAGAPRVELDLPFGIVTAEADRSLTPELVAIAPPPVTLGAVIEDAQLVAALLGLTPEDLALDIAPAQVTTVGLRYLQAPLRGREALERCRPDTALLELMDEEHGFNQLSAFCLDPYTTDALAAVRMFAPLHGVYEDPATGSNAACLAAYFLAHGLIGDSGAQGRDVAGAATRGAGRWTKLDQGYSLHRPSALYIQANAQPDGAVIVRVGGQCVEVIRGRMEF